MRVIICGGGVIGACLAYDLSRAGADVLLVERHRIAGAASGKSGGFLALDWCDGSPLAPLARRSFERHRTLAETHGNPWGYRRLDTYAADNRCNTSDVGAPLSWLNPTIQVQGQLGDETTTAQVTPEAFTTGMADLAAAQDAVICQGAITSLAFDREGVKIQGVEIDGRREAADAVVIAMGPWSTLARRWLPLPEVHGLKGHSIVLRPGKPVPAEALFAEIRGQAGAPDTPELFPRPDGTVYLCGLSSYEPLPIDPEQVVTHDQATRQLMSMAAALSPQLRDAEMLSAGACYRPVTRDGLPLLGAVPGIEGAYIATGHNVWGMLNAPASGEAMAGLILEGRSASVDLTPFDPARPSL